MSTIDIVVNGKEQTIKSDSTIQDVLAELNISSPMLVVEKNLNIVPKDKYSDFLSKGDRLEIVGFFGGG